MSKQRTMIISLTIGALLIAFGYHMYCHHMVSRFFDCVEADDYEETLAIIRNMPDVNMRDSCYGLYYIKGVFTQFAVNKGRPLDYAVYKGVDVSILEALLEKGADPNKKDMSGVESPFQALFQYPSEDMDAKVSLMVEYGADTDSISLPIPAYFSDCDEETKAEILAYITLLWEAGVSDTSYAGTRFERTVLHSAAECLDAEYLEQLYHNKTRDMTYLLNERDVNGETPIFMAVRANQYDNCELLIEEGADIMITNDDGKTAYDIAVELGHRKCAEILHSME